MDITLDQALEARNYVRTYYETLGVDPVEAMLTPGYEKNLPPDVRKAAETAQAFWRHQEESGRTL